MPTGESHEALRALALYDDDEAFKVIIEALDSDDTWMSVPRRKP